MDPACPCQANLARPEGHLGKSGDVVGEGAFSPILVLFTREPTRGQGLASFVTPPQQAGSCSS